MKRIVLAAVLATAFLACHRLETRIGEHGGGKERAGKGGRHRKAIEAWHKTRLEHLTAPDGWLSLVGLNWLHEGANTFGSDKSNDIVLPPSAPAKAGIFTFSKGVVTLKALVPMEIDNKPVQSPVTLLDDSQAAGPTIVKMGTYLLQIIKRGDRYGLRSKDSEAETRTKFLGLDYFPTDRKWRIVADFIPYNPPKQIPITDVTGMTSMSQSPGALKFEVDGKEYRIDPVIEEGSDGLFVIFKDETSRDATYPAARYVYTEKIPGRPNQLLVDFNKAYNPPCAFTHFATCPLPPPQNRLPFRIEAGEKRYRGGHF